MKTPFVALLMSLWLVVSCSWLNPFAERTEKMSAAFVPNEFLWQAAKEKLSFMTIVQENKPSGFLIAEWEQFKVEVKVLSPSLRTDALSVSAYVKVDGEEKPAEKLDDKLENAILNRARILYRESLAIK